MHLSQPGSPAPGHQGLTVKARRHRTPVGYGSAGPFERLAGGAITVRPCVLLSCRGDGCSAASSRSWTFGDPVGPGAKLGSHPAKVLGESGEVRRAICPARSQSGTLLDSGQGPGLICKQRVGGSSPLSSTLSSTRQTPRSRSRAGACVPVTCPNSHVPELNSHVPDLPSESPSGGAASWPSSLAARSLTAAAMARWRSSVSCR
jgi:hypothetical protein